MEAIGVIGFIIIIILVFLAFSLLGWGAKLLEKVLEFLGEGCSSSFGCIFWIIIILAVIAAFVG